MKHRDRYSLFDREELLEKVRETHKQLFGHRPDGDIYNALGIKALKDILSELRGSSTSQLCDLKRMQHERKTKVNGVARRL